MINMQEPGWYFDAYYEGRGILHTFHKRRIDTIYDLVPTNKEVLDVGCGSGILLYLLSDVSKSVHGIDIRKDCIEFCREKIPKGVFTVADSRNFNLGRQFDVVVCTEMVEHFEPDERTLILNNLDRHVKDGGLLILSFPSKRYLTLEPLWMWLKKLMYSGRVFDDEDTHLLVNANDIEKEMREYEAIKKGTACMGLIVYMVMKKCNSH